MWSQMQAESIKDGGFEVWGGFYVSICNTTVELLTNLGFAYFNKNKKTLKM